MCRADANRIPCDTILGPFPEVAAVRTMTIATVVLLLAGCQRSPKPPAPRPAQAPVVQATDQAAQAAAATKKEEPKKDRFPLDQDQFKAAVMGSTREQLLAKYGPPDEVLDLPAAVGWDGPLSIYRGPFTSADGKQAAKAQVYFRRSGGPSVAAQVGFENK